ncbi:MAG: protein TolR [Gammaproteobacteria bacterium]|nr:protein TolR [Gammaproteobacteria bacterium]
MSSVPRRIRKKPMADINVVPYIDVMLVLLVIFMITAPLLTQGVNVDLPQAAAEPMDGDIQEPLIVSVDVQGNYYLNVGENPDGVLDHNKMVTLVAAVLRHKPGTPVMIRGDANVQYEKVVTAMTLLQKAGAPSVGLITRPAENPRKSGK